MKKHQIFLTCSVITYILFTLLPYKYWIRWSNLNLEPLPNIFYSDSIYYIGKIREIIKGNNNVGNPIIYENSEGSFSYGDSSLFYIWGTFGRVTDLNVVQTYLVMISINSAILVFSIYSFFLLVQNKNIAICCSLLISVFFIQELGRPSPTQQLLPFLILAITIVFRISLKHQEMSKLKRIFNKFGFLVIALFIISGNPLYSLMLFLVTLTYVFLFPQSSRFCFWLSTVINVGYFIWNNSTLDSLDELIGNRFGIHSTRVPGALRITIPLMIIIILLALLLKTLLIKEILSKQMFILKVKIYLIYSIALLIAVNSQIITGKAYEMESHYILVWKLFLGIILSELIIVSINKINEFKNGLTLHLNKIMVFFTILPLILVSQFRSVQTFESSVSKLLREIESNNYKVVLVKNDSEFSGIEDDIIYHTQAYLYWHPYAVAAKITQQDISARFACAENRILSFSEYKSEEGNLYFHQYANDRLKSIQLNRFLNLFGLKSKPYVYEQFLVADYNSYINEQELCIEGIFKFRVDKII
jgi:hypothetical protein